MKEDMTRTGTAGHDAPPEARGTASSGLAMPRIRKSLAVRDHSDDSAGDVAIKQQGEPGKNSHPPRRWKGPLKLSGLALVACCAIFAGVRWWMHAQSWVETDNAYVASHIHTISARVSGTVQEVLVDENQAVTPGAVVLRLDARDFEVHKQQALAQLAQARAQAAQAKAQVMQADAQANREQARATKAEQDLVRAKSLFEGGAGAISRQEYDQAMAEAEAAQAAVQAAQATVTSAGAAATAGEAQVEAALANLKEVELQLSYTQIVAPAGGRIGKKNVETGNRIQPGQALLALVEPKVWVTANFKETQLAKLHSGQPVRVRLDAFPGKTFTGKVDSVSPASGAQFALLPPDNATGNFTRIVQRLPVKILLDEQALGEFKGRIAPGMSAEVEVNIDG